MITVFVGDVTNKVQIVARDQDPTAQLIEGNNSTDLASGTYYTSLGDCLTLDQFINILEQADILIYVPPEIWSDTDNKNFSYMKKWTEFFLLYFQDKKSVSGIDDLFFTDQINSILTLVDARKTDSAQLWVAGCSITDGLGVTDQERYGQLIADYLDLPVSFLSTPGSSIPWAADQILRSDIRSGDIVIFGLTSANRFTYYHDDVTHVNVRYYKQHPEFNNIMNISCLDNSNQHYQVITSIHRVINYCRLIKAKLIIAGILIDYDFLPLVANLPNYIQLFGKFGLEASTYFLDTSSIDDEHPGPKMHKWYADQIVSKFFK